MQLNFVFHSMNFVNFRASFPFHVEKEEKGKLLDNSNISTFLNRESRKKGEKNSTTKACTLPKYVNFFEEFTTRASKWLGEFQNYFVTQSSVKVERNQKILFCWLMTRLLSFRHSPRVKRDHYWRKLKWWKLPLGTARDDYFETWKIEILSLMLSPMNMTT